MDGDAEIEVLKSRLEALSKQVDRIDATQREIKDQVVLDRSLFVPLTDFKTLAERVSDVKAQVSSIIVVGVIAGLLIPIAVVIINHIWK